jgi:hypothetical protein
MVQAEPLSSAVWSPWVAYDDCRAIQWPLAGPPASGLCRLTTRSVAAGSLPGSGSLHTVLPAGTVTVCAPPKASRRLLPGRSSAPCFWMPA